MLVALSNSILAFRLKGAQRLVDLLSKSFLKISIQVLLICELPQQLLESERINLTRLGIVRSLALHHLTTKKIKIEKQGCT